MDNQNLELLERGAALVGAQTTSEQRAQLLAYAAFMLKWNSRIQVTSITDWPGVIERHLIDSVAVLPELTGQPTVLDLGAGGGLPGIPLALLLPELRVTMVDSVAKKVAFLKNAIVHLGIQQRVSAVAVRLEGAPEREGLARVSCVISRAFMALPQFVQLARHYASADGRIVAMLGRAPSDAELHSVEREEGLVVESFRTFELPFSHSPRAVAVLTTPRPQPSP